LETVKEEPIVINGSVDWGSLSRNARRNLNQPHGPRAEDTGQKDGGEKVEAQESYAGGQYGRGTEYWPGDLRTGRGEKRKAKGVSSELLEQKRAVTQAGSWGGGRMDRFGRNGRR